MSRTLKIVSPRRHPGPRGSEGSASGRISTKMSPPNPETGVIGQAGSRVSPLFDPALGQRQLPTEQTPWEARKQRIAMNTINKLMITVSHYLSNPLTILLGRVELLSEATENGEMSKGEIKKFVESCKREIHKIDLIIKVFQNLCEVRYKTYPPGIKMFDVENEIKNRLKEIEPCLRNEKI
jgi:signal transduction histidine kinase